MMAAETHFETLTLDDDEGAPFSARLISTVHAPINGGDPLLHPPPSPSSSSSSPSSSPTASSAVGFVAFEPQNGSVSTSAAAAAAAVEYTKITVSDPQKENDPGASLVSGSGTYVSYLITFRSAGGGGEHRVRRRFRDVVTLADRLAESYRGFFIPTRPDKSVVEGQVMQKHEFVEQRRAEIQKYLRRLAAHPAIGRGEELKAFLRTPGRMSLPAAAAVATGAGNVAVPAKGGRDFFRMFRELKQSVTNDWGGVRPLVVEEDKEFLERKEKVQDLEQQLTTASQHAEALVKAQQDLGETMGEFGLAFIKLGKFETAEALLNSQKIRASEIKTFATAAVKASRLQRGLTAQTAKHLDTLHEYMGLLLAVHGAFAERSSALLTVQTTLSDLASLHSRAEKFEAAASKSFGGDRSRSGKIQELKETIRATEDAKSCALRDYEHIKENNRNELDRLDRERHGDFIAMLKGFVINQVGYSEKIANVWATLAEETSGFAKKSN
ncbi:sorting nexin 2B-like [Typha latifolia]|uniref:sorting nexin 2B-like n=1 Tax=Typha latifolia TaxID=4733 RepID=UPI003C30C31E